MPPPLSRENRIYLAIWKKGLEAARKDQEYKVQLRTHGEACALRTALYRAIKPFRLDELMDEELYKAGELLGAYVPFRPEKLAVVIIRKRMMIDITNGLFDDLGLDELDLMTVEEKLLFEDRSKGPVASEHSDNPFYGKRD